MIRQWIIVTYHHWWWCRSPWVHSRRNKRETETDTWVSQIVRFQRFVQLHSPINRNKASLQSSAEAGAEECFEKVTTETKTCVKCKIFSSQDSSVLFFSILLSFFSSPLQQLPVITSNTIVRCRSCRTYINPFVTFLDQRRWKCNLCYRVNDGMWYYWSCVQSCKFIIIASFCVSCVSSFFVFLVQFQMSSCTTPSPGRTASPIRDQRSRTPPWSSSPPQTTWWAASSESSGCFHVTVCPLEGSLIQVKQHLEAILINFKRQKHKCVAMLHFITHVLMHFHIISAVLRPSLFVLVRSVAASSACRLPVCPRCFSQRGGSGLPEVLLWITTGEPG